MAGPSCVLTAFFLLAYGASQVQSTNDIQITNKSLTTAPIATNTAVRLVNKVHRRRKTNPDLWQHRRETNADLWQHQRETNADLRQHRRETNADLRQSRRETNADLRQRRRETNADLWQHRRETNADLWQHRRETNADLRQHRRETKASLRHPHRRMNTSSSTPATIPTAQSSQEQGRHRNASRTAQRRRRITSVPTSPANRRVQATRTGPSRQTQKQMNPSLTRRRRYDYEEIYEWKEEEGDYETQEYFEEVERPFFQKVMMNWQTALPRLIMMAAPFVLVCMCYSAIAYAACQLWCKTCWDMCPCKPIQQFCQMFYSDPMYEKVKELGKVFGVHISYTTFEKILQHYGIEQFDPFNFKNQYGI